MNITQIHVENIIKSTLDLSVRKNDDGNGYQLYNLVTSKLLTRNELSKSLDMGGLHRDCLEEGIKFWVLASNDSIQVSSQAIAEKMIPIVYKTWMQQAMSRGEMI
jgi:hypothetical protein